MSQVKFQDSEFGCSQSLATEVNFTDELLLRAFQIYIFAQKALQKEHKRPCREWLYVHRAELHGHHLILAGLLSNNDQVWDLNMRADRSEWKINQIRSEEINTEKYISQPIQFKEKSSTISCCVNNLQKVIFEITKYPGILIRSIFYLPPISFYLCLKS